MLLPDAKFKTVLEKVVERLRHSTTEIDIRGNNIGQFIYAANNFRSVEISQSHEGIWIEFWEKQNELPVKEITVSNYEEAISVSVKWLNRN